MNQTPDAMVTYKLYNSGQYLIGTGEIELPTIQFLTSELKGAGILGAIDRPIRGMPQSMVIGINWRTITENGISLLKYEQQHIESWGAIQITDPGTGKYKSVQHKIIAKGDYKSLALGKHSVAEIQGRKAEIEVVYLREEYDGEEHLEIDKENFVFRVDGEDQLADVRTAIGM